jgi:hypothetical protein
MHGMDYWRELILMNGGAWLRLKRKRLKAQLIAEPSASD